MTTPRPSLPVRLTFVAGVLVTTAAICAAVLEVALRFTDPMRTRPPAPVTIVPDPELGWDSAPTVSLLDRSIDGPIVYFAGDSFTQNAAWPAHAQRVASVPFRGVNLGVSGFGVTQSLLKIQRHFDQHRPALVVLQLYPWNDLRDDSSHPRIFYSPERSRRPYFERHGDSFILRPTEPEGALSQWFGQTQLYQRVWLRAYLRMTRMLAEHDLDGFLAKDRAWAVHYHEPSLWAPFYRPSRQQSLYVRHAYAVLEHGLLSLRRYLDQRGAELVIVAIGNAFSVDADVLEAYGSGEDFHQTLPEETLEQIAARHGIPFVSTVEPLRALAKRTGRKVYNPPAGSLAAHLEPEAEQVVGHVAAEAIVRTLTAIPPVPPSSTRTP